MTMDRGHPECIDTAAPHSHFILASGCEIPRNSTVDRIDHYFEYARAYGRELLSQRLPPAKQSGSAIAATLSAIEHLGYIQIDTISVIQRAHHHTLWNRNPHHQASHLDELIADKQVFEYWSHAAAYLPMRDYRSACPANRQ